MDGLKAGGRLRFRRATLALLALSGILLLLAAPAQSAWGSPSPPPTSALAMLPLIRAANLRYLGAFRLPNEDSHSNSLAYGGNALGMDPVQHGLWFGGHDWYQKLCEVSIPAVINLSQTATILQDCVDVTEGRLDQIDPQEPNSKKLGGTLVYHGRLIVAAYSYYDADGSQVLSHFTSSRNLAQSGDVQGPFQVGDWAGIVSGYLGFIPAEWQASLGAPALTGQCCIAIISRTSAGPAASAFDPDQVGATSGPTPATPLVYYPLDHPLAPETTQNDLFNLATQIKGLAFPAGSRSLLFFGRQGTGPYCYGTGGNGDCYDPADSSKGTHAYPYRHQVWSYDALDLLAVKKGEKQPWEIRPYAVWPLNEMDASGGATVRGVTYDPESGRVYLTEAYGEEPIVHVYQISTPRGEYSLYLPVLRH